MAIDAKIKQAALETAVGCLLRGARLSPERAARNILELVCGALPAVDVAAREQLYGELLALLPTAEPDQVKAWAVRTVQRQ